MTAINLATLILVQASLAQPGIELPETHEQLPAPNTESDVDASEVRQRERVMRQWFGSAFEPLDPKIIVSAPRDNDALVHYLKIAHGICLESYETREDVDEFVLQECENKAAAFRKSPEPSPVFELSAWGETSVRYDFKRSAWVITWTDELRGTVGCDDPGLSIWKPTMPNAPPKECRTIDGYRECSTPYVLPKKYRTLTHLIPMSPGDAKLWKTEHASTMYRDVYGRDGVILAKITSLVTVKPRSNWRKNYKTRSPDGEHITDCLRGSLAKVHGLRIEAGNYQWSYPVALAAPPMNGAPRKP